MTEKSLIGEYSKSMKDFQDRETELRRSLEQGDASQRASIQSQLDQHEKEKIEFMLNAAPFLEKYYHKGNEKEDSGSKSTKGLRAFFGTKVNEKRGELYEDYMHQVENVIVEPAQKRDYVQPLLCSKCKVNMIYVPSEASIYCPDCGHSEDYMDTSVTKVMTYDQENTGSVTINFAYKRINHLTEHLACFQGKESTNIPQEVIDALRSEFKKQRITDSKEITPTKVRAFLRKLKLNKYYEHSVMITFMLNGIPPPSIDQRTEDLLKTMFKDIQWSFERNRPKGRVNFLSYSYCIRKMCELIERDDIAVFFPFLKSHEKLEIQDKMWKNICKDLNYEFIPSSNMRN